MQPAVFFDRDGIVNRPPNPARYVNRVEEFHLLPEFVAALRVVLARGYEAVIVTNQKGVGRGWMTQAALDQIHDRLVADLAAEGLSLRDILFCAAVEDDDPRRKPNPGMLLEAAAKHDLDLKRSWMIGDSETDIEAGRRAGCAGTVRVAPPSESTAADHHLPDMTALAGWLEADLPPAAP